MHAQYAGARNSSALHRENIPRKCFFGIFPRGGAPKRARVWLRSSEMLKTANRRREPSQVGHRGGLWKDMLAYIPKDHLVFGIALTSGTELRKQIRGFREEADFKGYPRYRQRTDRPSQPPSSCGEFISRGRACQPPHSNEKI